MRVSKKKTNVQSKMDIPDTSKNIIHTKIETNTIQYWTCSTHTGTVMLK